MDPERKAIDRAPQVAASAVGGKGGGETEKASIGARDARSFKPQPPTARWLATLRQVSQAHEYGQTAALMGSLCHRRRAGWMIRAFFREAAGEAVPLGCVVGTLRHPMTAPLNVALDDTGAHMLCFFISS